MSPRPKVKDMIKYDHYVPRLGAQQGARACSLVHGWKMQEILEGYLSALIIDLFYFRIIVGLLCCYFSH